MCGLSGSTIFFYIIPSMEKLTKNFVEHKMCVFILSTNLSEIFFIVRGIHADTITQLHRSSCNLPVIVVSF